MSTTRAIPRWSPRQGTRPARQDFTSVFGWEPVFPLWCGRRRRQNDWMGFARINPLRFISGPFCGTYRPFAVLSWEHTTDTPYMGFFTGDGPDSRGFNATYFVVFDVSKISK